MTDGEGGWPLSEWRSRVRRSRAWESRAWRLLRADASRLTATYVAVFAASAVLLGLAVYLTARTALENQMTTRIEGETALLLGEYRTGGLPRLLVLVRLREQGRGALEYGVYGADGTTLVGELPGGVRAAAPGWATIRVDEADEADRRSIEVRTLVTALGGGATLAVGDDLTRIGELRESIARAYVATVGLLAVLGVGGGLLVSRAFLARVDAISRTAEAIIGGDLSQRIPVRGAGGDLDRLAATLNHMLDRMATLMDSLRLVSADVAHDLRTPLSRLYQRLEHARSHATNTADYEAAVDSALAEAEALLATFAALLRIAQVEGASPHAALRPLDLSAVVDAVVDAYRPDAEEAGHRLDATVQAGVMVAGDAELLTQALANLVENALRHTPAGTRIAVTLAGTAQGDARLSVVDDGPGVVAADLPRLTRRFFRGERSRTAPGNGLGLSLVAAVADLHGASLIIGAASPGLAVTLELPARPGAPRRPAPPC